jgi:hypothetical protein
MSEVNQLCVIGRQVLSHIAPLPEHLPLLKVQQSAKRAQQRGLATAICASYEEQLAGVYGEIKSGEQMMLAAPQV